MIKRMWKNEFVFSCLFTISFALTFMLVLILAFGSARYQNVMDAKSGETYANSQGYLWGANVRRLTLKEAYYHLPKADTGIYEWYGGGTIGNSMAETVTISFLFQVNEPYTEELAVTYDTEEVPQVYIGQGLEYLTETEGTIPHIKVDGVDCVVKGILKADTYADDDERLIVVTPTDELLDAYENYTSLEYIYWRSNEDLSDRYPKELEAWLETYAEEVTPYSYDVWENDQGYLFNQRNGLERTIYLVFLLYCIIAVMALIIVYTKTHMLEWTVYRICGESQIRIFGRVFVILLLYVLQALILDLLLFGIFYICISKGGFTGYFGILQNSLPYLAAVLAVTLVMGSVISSARIWHTSIAEELRRPD